MKIKDGIWCAIAAFWLAVIFVTAMFLAPIISYRSFPGAVAYIILTAGAYGFIMISPGGKILALKWLLSIPFGYCVLQFFWRTDYALRALNWVYPGYGRQSAGGKFAGFFLWMMQFGACMIAVAAGLMIRPKEKLKFERLQMILGTLIAAGIIVLVIALERQFPEKVTVLLG